MASNGAAAEGGAHAGTVTFITGAAGGIGSAVARKFVAEGGRVVIADIAEESGLQLVQALGEDKAFFTICDVRSDESVSAAFDAALDHFGALHGAVLNAGIVGHNHTLPLTEVTTEDFDQTIATNLSGVWHCLKHAARAIKKQGLPGGSIVTIASIGGMRGSPAIDTPYQIAKAGVIGLTYTAAAKLAKDGIRVNCVSPTSVETPMMAGVAAQSPEAKARLEATLPMLCPLLRRMVAPDELAGIISFLASGAANNLTGVNLPVDQGWSAGANGLM